MQLCECKCHHWDAKLDFEDFLECNNCCEWFNEKNIRPWGRYDILYDGDDCKVKRITIKPGAQLSYQYHYKRKENWQIISGKGIVVLNGEESPVKPNSIVTIWEKEKHTMINNGVEDLIFIEVQTGSYFGEDDIVRIKDNYGRA